MLARKDLTIWMTLYFQALVLEEVEEVLPKDLKGATMNRGDRTVVRAIVLYYRTKGGWRA